MYELAGAGKVESFILITEPGAKMGVRLIKQASVRRYFEEEAAKQAKQTGPSPIAAKGREGMAANRAKRAAEKEAMTAQGVSHE
jgi:hypothetical protein